MYHPLPREWLLATNKIEVGFHSAIDAKPGHGSGFWVRTASEEVMFVTNRHVVDIEYFDERYFGHGYKVSSIRILTFKGAERFGHLIVKAELSWPSDHRVDIAILRNLKVINKTGIVIPASTEMIADKHFLNNKLNWGDLVSFTSFQPWRDSKSERPILRTGTVSSDPLYSYESTAIPRRGVLLLVPLNT